MLFNYLVKIIAALEDKYFVDAQENTAYITFFLFLLQHIFLSHFTDFKWDENEIIFMRLRLKRDIVLMKMSVNKLMQNILNPNRLVVCSV
jgi:hypothetical protein